MSKKIPKRVVRKLGQYSGKVNIYSFAEKDKAGILVEIIDGLANKTGDDTDLRETFVEDMDDD